MTTEEFINDKLCGKEAYLKLKSRLVDIFNEKVFIEITSFQPNV